MAKKSMIQREIKRKCLVNRFSKKRKIVKQKLRDIMLNPNDNMYEETWICNAITISKSLLHAIVMNFDFPLIIFET